MFRGGNKDTASIVFAHSVFRKLLSYYYIIILYICLT